MATQSEIAEHLDLSQQAVSQMVRAGVLPDGGGRNGLDVETCRVAYIRHLREVAAGRQAAAKGDGLDIVAERARLAKEQADAQAMKNAVTRGQVILADDAVRVIGESCGTVRTYLLAMPSSAAPRLFRCKSIGELQEMLMTLIVQALEELSTGFERLTSTSGDDESSRDGGSSGTEGGGGNADSSIPARRLGYRSDRS